MARGEGGGKGKEEELTMKVGGERKEGGRRRRLGPHAEVLLKSQACCEDFIYLPLPDLLRPPKQQQQQQPEQNREGITLMTKSSRVK